MRSMLSAAVLALLAGSAQAGTFNDPRHARGTTDRAVPQRPRRRAVRRRHRLALGQGHRREHDRRLRRSPRHESLGPGPGRRHPRRRRQPGRLPRLQQQRPRRRPVGDRAVARRPGAGRLPQRGVRCVRERRRGRPGGGRDRHLLRLSLERRRRHDETAGEPPAEFLARQQGQRRRQHDRRLERPGQRLPQRRDLEERHRAGSGRRQRRASRRGDRRLRRRPHRGRRTLLQHHHPQVRGLALDRGNRRAGARLPDHRLRLRRHLRARASATTAT